MLEWTDDLEVFMLKGYGNSLNYKMGIPLLEDVLHSMEEAIKAREGNVNLKTGKMMKFLLVILITRFNYLSFLTIMQKISHLEVTKKQDLDLHMLKQ